MTCLVLLILIQSDGTRAKLSLDTSMRYCEYDTITCNYIDIVLCTILMAVSVSEIKVPT